MKKKRKEGTKKKKRGKSEKRAYKGYEKDTYQKNLMHSLLEE